MEKIKSGLARQHILDTAQKIIGVKGFSAVGLNELLKAADVPKGSFYHYFSSKEAFGEALLENYFRSYLAGMQKIFDGDALANRNLSRYLDRWIDNQTAQTDATKCLAVKLGVEVTDLSEPMRQKLLQGTAKIIECLDAALARGQEQGSMTLNETPEQLAAQLYALWLGASVMAKITHTNEPFDQALLMTRRAVGNVEQL
ncbi:TetR/AcrR family transcriptional regulator [Pseudomonas sp. Pseusp122]|uniref:TetR/AcrR family transcriptional regulator n=1 Tax=unclassified Pseudomonas TaxID=196821 RepID=UPI0039A5950A